jgi:CheY-like chemotaxis protein/anti-sigma regulatory factor (Ser/Thr protein kinase)
LKIKILIVDDEPVNIELLEALLGPEGYDLQKARNGQDALDQLKTSDPDLVLLDIMMPFMSGYKVLEEIRKNKITAAVPVILLTALADRDHMIKGIDAGADDYISKPFDKTELLSRVRTQARLSILRRQINEKDKLLGVIELITDGIAVTDGTFNIQHLNAAATSMFGINGVHENLAELFMDSFGQAIELKGESGGFITEIPATEGSMAAHMSTRFRKASGPGNDDGSFVFVFRDISEEYGRNMMKVDFLSRISDKLRAPLAVIRGYSNLIATHPPQEQLQELTGALVVNSELAEKLVDRVLFFSELDNAYFSETFDASRNASAGELDLRDMMNVFEIVYKRQFDLKTEKDIIDVKKWQKIALEELIENAFKYSNKDKLVLKVSAGPGGIIVEDNGPGIDETERENVFEPFYGVKIQPPKNPGAGLGLAIVRRVASSGNMAVMLEAGESGGLRVVIAPKKVVPGKQAEPQKITGVKKTRATRKKAAVPDAQAGLWG